jgi:hypothetical protein
LALTRFNTVFADGIPTPSWFKPIPGLHVVSILHVLLSCKAGGDEILGRFRYGGINPETAGPLQHDVA